MSRPRKPTALKVVGGTARADRINAHEPEPNLLEDLAPPPHLTARSAVVWLELAPLLRKNMVLTEMDVLAFELLCDSVADYRHARAERGDSLVTTSSKGSQMLDQLLIAQQACAKRAETMMGRFGMDPVSRSRVMIDPQRDLFDTGPKTGPGRHFND